MRALLSTIGSRGDVQPLVALALELRTLDVEARLCVPPDFRGWIEGLGLPVTPIGPEVRGTARPKPKPDFSPENRRALAEGTVHAQFETIAAAAEGCDVILGATALQIAARSVAETMGIPYVFAAYCPNVVPSDHHAPPVLPLIPGQDAPPETADNRELWDRDAARFHDLFGAALNAHRETLGLGPVDDTRAHVLGDRPWLAADARLGPWPDPDNERVFQTGAWIVPDGRPLDATLEAFLASGEPPVYFGFGSMRAPRDLGEVAVHAARAFGRRAIVSRGWADVSVAEPDADCLVIGEVNQQALFPKVGAVVHHGGAGTTTAVARAGAPQVVVPGNYDQHYWARRIEELGVGAAHTPGAPTTESLTTALEVALEPAVAIRARSLSAEIHLDGARVAAEALGEILRRTA